MTDKKFIKTLRRGLGSAIIEIKESTDKTKYRDMILHCCLHDITYDWQVEGTKGYYLYTAICELGSKDKAEFESLIIDKFLSRCNDTLFYQLAEILEHYAYDGSERAKEAFRKKYDYFLTKNGRLSKRPMFDDGMQWDETAYQLFIIGGFPEFKRYLIDVGKILSKRSDNRHFFDEWLIVRAEDLFGKKRIQKFLDKNYEKFNEIKTVVDIIKADKIADELRQEKKELVPITIDELLIAARKSALAKHPRYEFVGLGRKFGRYVTEADLVELSNRILAENDKTVKALLLLPFSFPFKNPRLFPKGIDPLIEYVQSDNELLSEIAVSCLEYFKDKRIHDFAIHLLQTKGINSLALGLLKENYKKSDDNIIYAALKKSTIVPHHVQMDVREIYLKNSSPKAFSTLLRVYENGDCAFCRYYIIKAMYHCKVLTDKLLQECRYDFYDDTREFAKQIIAKREKKQI